MTLVLLMIVVTLVFGVGGYVLLIVVTLQDDRAAELGAPITEGGDGHG